MLVAEESLDKMCPLMNEGNNSGIAYTERFEILSIFLPWSSQAELDPRSPAIPASFGRERDDQQPRSSRLELTEKDWMYLNLQAR